MKTFKSSLLFLVMLTFIQFGFSQNQDKKIIVMFGNSITNQGKWEEALGRTDVLNWGIPGYTTGQLIWTIKNVLHDHSGTKIWFLEGGINDISLGVPVDRIFENYKITVDSLKRNHIIPVVQSTILKNNAKADNMQVTKLNKMVKKYCMKYNIEYIDLNAFLSHDGELIKELTTDGCHLQPQAYKPWGEEVKKVLTKYGI
jgi:lysophospholipase L1-like esterase